MYLQHFNLTQPPFSIAPDPRYFYLSPRHREALAHLLYGIGVGGGFVLLTGEVGTGKTTLCRCLLEQLPVDVDLALIFNPRLNSVELLASICDELRIPYRDTGGGIKTLIDALNHHLLEMHARGRRTVVLIDEAQNLSFDVLEQIRLLTNLETNRDKLLQIILVGQPELNRVLERPELRQLAQRITARYHLTPLSSAEAKDYIAHRLKVSGAQEPFFTRWALSAIYRRSGGIPRLINLMCDRALLGAYAVGQRTVTYRIVRKAAQELRPPARVERNKLALAGSLAGVALLTALMYTELVTVPGHWLVALHRESSFKTTPKVTQQHSPSQESVSSESTVATKSADGVTLTQPDPAATLSMAPAKPVATDVPAQNVSNQSARSSDAEKTEVKPAVMADFAAMLIEPGLTRDAALRRLLALWKIDLPPGTDDPCLLAFQNGLRCLSGRGNWFQLRTMGRPVVLEFTLANGDRRYATLLGADDRWVKLGLVGTERVVELLDMLPYWRGQWTVLWKAHPNDGRSLVPGERNEAVRWLRMRLGGMARPGEEDYFDPVLRARVVAFQQGQGLQPDGIVGPLTMIHMDDDPTVPRLETISR